MPKMSALVDDFDDTGTILVPGFHPYATVVTTIYDAEGGKVEERRLFAGTANFDKLPGGQKVNLKGKRKPSENGAEGESEDAPAEATPARRGR